MSSFLPAQFQQVIADKNNYNMVVGILLFILFLLIFFFRDQLSQFKEILKAKVRNTLKPMFFKVENGTLHSSPEGTMNFIWNYLDTCFLAPSEAGETGVYDYLPSEDDEPIETIEPFRQVEPIEEEEDGNDDDDDDDDDDEDSENEDETEND